VGFRVLSRHPDWLHWLIIQNINGYEVGFTAAWEGFGNALWKHRTPETEQPLMAFLNSTPSRTSICTATSSPS
jgi:hypothetical protein